MDNQKVVARLMYGIVERMDNGTAFFAAYDAAPEEVKARRYEYGIIVTTTFDCGNRMLAIYDRHIDTTVYACHSITQSVLDFAPTYKEVIAKFITDLGIPTDFFTGWYLMTYIEQPQHTLEHAH